MEDTIDYLKEVFGGDLNFTEIQKERTNTLPFYITSEYAFQEASLFDRNIVFAKKITPEHFTPDQYKKQLELLERNFNQSVIFVLPEIEAYNRNRLIQKRINFVIANKQIFIPCLAVDIKEYALKTQRKEYLQPAAQCLVLYHLQKENLNHFNYKQLAEALKYPYLTITRAVENLQTLALCKVEGTKEKSIFFETGKAELWEKATPFMRSPVLKSVFIDDEINSELLFISNINALSHYSDLNDEKQLHFALHHDVYRLLLKDGKIKKVNSFDGKYSIETWKYAPEILANNQYVDPLSLVLEFKENNDERVQLALKSIIEQQKW
jgi:hypothetical protein